jgi:hypothetical protein
MEAVADSFTRGSGQNGSGISKIFLAAATPEMFRANAFRITGLRVDSTTREISKQADKLKMMEELGQGKTLHTGAFALTTPPTVDQIREAVQRLKDPEQRIIDEFFWFWPKQFGKSASDPAMKAIEAGDADTALQTWTALETSPSDGVVAMHNVAVYWHLRALEWEIRYAKTAELTAENRRENEKLWRGAFKRWELLAVDDLFWENVTARIQQIDDPRLTSGFTRKMRATLPYALDKINAELAVRYAEAGQMDRAQVHVQFMRETNEGLSGFEMTAELVLAPAATRLKQQIQRAKERAATNPAEAVNAARELLDHARRTLPLFELLFGKESVARNELSDEIGGLCNQLSVDYQKATGDDKGSIDLLRAALQFATSIDLQRQIEENISVLSGNLTFKQLEPAHAALKAIHESTVHPSIRLKEFRKHAAPAISNCSAGIVGSKEHTDLCDGAANILRGISLAAWNDHQVMTTAVAANELALTYVRSTELRQQLTADGITLRQMATQRTAAQQESPKRNGAGCLVWLVLFGLFGLISSFCSNKSSSSYSSPPAVPTPVYTAPASPNLPENGTYQQELDRDRQAVEAERTQLDQYSSQIDSLGAEIERDRASLNQHSQSAVDDFNLKVHRYNSMLQQLRSQSQAFNQMVHDYNAKLRR